MPVMNKCLDRFTLTLALLLAAAALPVHADVELTMSAQREVMQALADGSTGRRLEPATHLRDGDTLLITIRFVNTGDDTAGTVTIDNPVPPGTEFQPGGMSGAEAETQISVDGGATYRSEDGVYPPAVTHVRWLVHDVPAQGAGEVFLRLKVKAKAARP
jgi:uncharacterized repeat protein (TIGR01451 family)